MAGSLLALWSGGDWQFVALSFHLYPRPPGHGWGETLFKRVNINCVLARWHPFMMLARINLDLINPVHSVTLNLMSHLCGLQYHWYDFPQVVWGEGKTTGLMNVNPCKHKRYRARSKMAKVAIFLNHNSSLSPPFLYFLFWERRTMQAILINLT